MNDVTIPRAPLILGLAGLVPFWGLVGLLVAAPAFGWPEEPLAVALQSYAAVIVSFLGGIRWGIATVSRRSDGAGPYIVAVLPSLLAWATFVLSHGAGLGFLGFVALALGALDFRLVGAGSAPPWFGRLRLILSAGAGIALLLAAALVVLRH